MPYRFKKCSHCNGTGKEIDDTTTGQVMRAMRKSKGVSLRRLAYICCWSAAYVSDLELGNRHWNEAKMTRYVESLESLS